MYTLEERMKAVSLYFKRGRNSPAVRRKLGYPSKKALKLWVKEYESTGAFTTDTVLNYEILRGTKTGCGAVLPGTW